MATTELGAALRLWRSRVSPDAVGVRTGGRRRTPGLRREELAQLAGVSVDYVVRLEQGRSSTPSAHVVEALARALRLDSDQHSHLFDLAGLVPPGAHIVPRHITPTVHRMLDRHTGTPVAVFDAAWNQLLANPLYDALMGEWHGDDRNAVWRNFVGAGNRVRHTPESRAALQAAQAADLRRTAGRYPRDLTLQALIARLRHTSARFEELWTAGVVGEHHAARKTVDHPQVGALTLDCDVLTVAGSDQRIMIYTAEPGTPDAARLELLAVVGTQSLVSDPAPTADDS